MLEYQEYFSITLLKRSVINLTCFLKKKTFYSLVEFQIEIRTAFFCYSFTCL